VFCSGTALTWASVAAASKAGGEAEKADGTTAKANEEPVPCCVATPLSDAAAAAAAAAVHAVGAAAAAAASAGSA